MLNKYYKLYTVYCLLSLVLINILAISIVLPNFYSIVVDVKYSVLAISFLISSISLSTVDLSINVSALSRQSDL